LDPINQNGTKVQNRTREKKGETQDSEGNTIIDGGGNKRAKKGKLKQQQDGKEREGLFINEVGKRKARKRGAGGTSQKVHGKKGVLVPVFSKRMGGGVKRKKPSGKEEDQLETGT